MSPTPEHYPLPPEGTLHRHFYDRAVRLGYPIDAFHTQIDAQIDSFNDQADELIRQGAGPNDLIPELTDISHRMSNDIQTFLDKEREATFELTGNRLKESTTSLRLRLLGRTAEHHLMWPILAKYGRDNQSAKRARGELSESMYGDTVDYLHYLMSPQSHFMDFSDGVQRGAFNEVTALALCNRGAGSNRIALLGSLADDYRKRIDFRHLRFNGNPHELESTAVQVKTKHGLDLSQLMGVKIITAKDMGNLYSETTRNRYMNFATSRAMIREVNGEASQRDITHLDSILAQQAFRNIIHAK